MDRNLSRIALIASAVLATACATPAGSAASLAAPSPERTPSPGTRVAIRTTVDFTKTPFSGTFEVTKGAEALGCEGGTFEDAQSDLDGIVKTITCTRGGTGTVAIRARTMTLGCEPGPPETCGGAWTVDTATPTGDFEGLSGFGEFEVAFTEENAAEETLTGEIRFE